MKEQKYIDYFVVTDENLRKQAKYLTIIPRYKKTFKSSYEARQYMIKSIAENSCIELNFTLTIERRLNPKYTLSKRIEELEKELKERKEQLAEYE
jgi:hypothetical protein